MTKLNEVDAVACDEFGHHEVLHVSSIAVDFWAQWIVEHPALMNSPLREKAEKIGELIADFYQDWGAYCSEMYR